MCVSVSQNRALQIELLEWRSNRLCKACSARGTIAVGGPDEPCVRKKGGALLESLHTCRSNRAIYATNLSPTATWFVVSCIDMTRSTCPANRASCFEPCCSTSSTQPKCMGSTRRTCRVFEIWRYVTWRAKLNSGFTHYYFLTCFLQILCFRQPAVSALQSRINANSARYDSATVDAAWLATRRHTAPQRNRFA